MNSWPRLFRASALAAAWLLSLQMYGSENVRTLCSPGGVIEVCLVDDAQIGFDVSRDGRPIVGVRELNLYFDQTGLGSVSSDGKPRVVSISEPQDVREAYRRLVPHAAAVSHYHQYCVEVMGTTGEPWRIEFRLFDDGAAYRLCARRSGAQKVYGDFAAWGFPDTATIWRKGAGNRSYEDEYKPSLIRELDKGHRFMMPATIELPSDAGYALITEANLVNYGDHALEVGAGHDFRHVYHDSHDGWPQNGDVVTPWRVVIATQDLNSLVNSDVVTSLCPAADESLQDAHWIRPGRCLWHWLTTGHPELTVQRSWIDGASDLGWEYYLIDDGWRDWNGGGDAAWAAMAELVQYAEQRDVSLWAWVHSKYLWTQEQRVEYFGRAKRTGLVGLKIDFPHPADREWVDWYDDTLRDAAEAQLLINFHGSVKPTGRERTWPHELTREAIRGREQGKLPASHDTALPFTRFVQGHADYTPTLLTPEALRGSTVAHELAMAVVYSSPLLCMGGGYEEYLSSRAVDVLRALPCTWDDTVVLPNSRIGELCAFARRSGDNWFVGVIGGIEGQTLEISTSFLADQPYECVELADTPGDNATFDRRTRTVTRGQALKVSLESDGGYVAYLRPKD